jgi:hypothetical protein
MHGAGGEEQDREAAHAADVSGASPGRQVPASGGHETFFDGRHCLQEDSPIR